MQAAKRPGADAVRTSDIARPRHVVEIAGGAAHSRHFQVTAETRKWPIKGAYKPRRAALFAGERGATPLIAAVEKPDTGKAEFGRDGVDLRCIRRTRSQEPSASHCIHGRQQARRDARQPVNAFFA